jgi:pyruvate dehydrogenase E1 component alpha subunit
MKVSKEICGELYRKMAETRGFEETAARLFTEGKVHGTAHFCIGEEATGVGVCSALEKEDMVTQTHRGHCQAIGKGMDIKKMMAEFLGKAAGYCKGKGGCMHIADFSVGSLGANGVVAGGIPVAVGAALSQQYFNRSNITVSFFGDGATNEGAFHESLNLASVWKLPVLFVCTNNYYGMSTHISKSMNITDIASRAASYGMKGISLDGNDVLAVYGETKKAREYILKNGPMFMVLNTYRWMGHSKSDSQVYRTREEVNQWKQKCPIKRFREYLLGERIFSEAELNAMDQKAKEDVAEAVSFAEAGEELGIERIFDDVYAQGDIRDQPPKNGFVL